MTVRRHLATGCLVAAVFAVMPAAFASASPAPLSVSGNRLLAGGAPVQLHGVNYTFLENACNYVDAEPPDVPATFGAMRAWGVNTVRLGVDAHCWLGVQGAPHPGAGFMSVAAYRAAVQQRIAQLESVGFWVVLVPQNADYLPDGDITEFWKSAAATLKNDRGLIFDLIGEVSLASYNETAAAPSSPRWDCWLHGCTINSIKGQGRRVAAGTQTLLDAVRGVGATQPIMVGSLGYDAEVDQWLSHVPIDPDHAVVLDQHRYDFVDDSHAGNAATLAAFDRYFSEGLVPIARRYPVVFGELGEDHCDDNLAGYVAHVLSRLDALQASEGLTISAIGWEWRAPLASYYGCPTSPPGTPGFGGPLLIRDYNGTANATGQALKSWFLAHPTVPGPPVPPPRASISLARSYSTRHGNLILKVRISGPGRVSARATSHGRVRLAIGRRVNRARLSFGSSNATATSAGLLTIAVHPSRAARRYLTAHHKLALDVHLAFTPIKGHAVTRTTRATASVH